MSEIAGEFSLSLVQVDNYQFRVDFDNEGLSPLTVDEAPPLGQNAGPNPSRLLAAAVGSCLSASLLFCLSKSRLQVRRIKTGVRVQIIRNERRRLRIGKIEVDITPDFADQDRQRAARCLELFEDFCTVTESVRNGIPIQVRVAGFDLA